MKSAAPLAALLAFLLAYAASAENVPIRWMLQTDGTNLYPAGIVAPAADVTKARAEADTLRAATAENTAKAAALTQRVDTLRNQIADATTDGAWALSLFCPAVGFAAKTDDGTSRIQWLTVPTPANSQTGTFIADQSIDLTRLTLEASASVADILANPARDKTATVTPNGTTTFPDGTPAWKYTVTLKTLPSSASGFFKLAYDSSLIVGTGNAFPIVGGLTVNGAPGRTLTVPAIDADGAPVTLTFIGGILVEQVQ